MFHNLNETVRPTFFHLYWKILLKKHSLLSLLQPHNMREISKSPIVIELSRCSNSYFSITLYMKTYMNCSNGSWESAIKCDWKNILGDDWFKSLIIRKTGSIVIAEITRYPILKTFVTTWSISLRKLSFKSTLLWRRGFALNKCRFGPGVRALNNQC